VFVCYVIPVSFSGSLILYELQRYVSNCGTGTNSGALHLVYFEDFALVNNSRKYLVRACAVHIIVEGGTQHP
jgi:hypothetical protein